MNFSTPRGFKDIMPKEAQIREDIRIKTQATLDLWGYRPIETPTLESVATLEAGERIGSEYFRLFDSDSELLVMRPDVTLAIARMVAQRLAPPVYAYRFRYMHNIFRESDPLKGESRELTQLGIELIGADGAISDAEVITLLVECLKSCGLNDFKMTLSSVSVLNALLEKSALNDSFKESVYKVYHNSDYVGLDALVESVDISDSMAQAFKSLLRLNGDFSVLDKCAELYKGLIDPECLNELYEIMKLLSISGADKYIEVDFSNMASFDYYTGFIMQVFAPGCGKPIAAGGRYNGLVGKFGKNMPAAGFSFYLERLTESLAYLDNLCLERIEPLIVSDTNDNKAFEQAFSLYEKGMSIKVER